MFCKEGPGAPNGGCLAPDGDCWVDTYTDGGRAGYPCVLTGDGSRWVLPMPGFNGGLVARSVEIKRNSYF